MSTRKAMAATNCASAISHREKIFALRPWRSFLPGIGSARSPPMKNNDDIHSTDTTEIKQLINRVKQGELDHEASPQEHRLFASCCLWQQQQQQQSLLVPPFSE